MPPNRTMDSLVKRKDLTPIGERPLEEMDPNFEENVKSEKNEKPLGKELAPLPTLDAIRSAIPLRCFQKNPYRSVFYLILDYAIIFLLYLVLPVVERQLGWTGLIIWYYIVGMFGMSLFVVGHDCGHGSFSDSALLNDLCGHLAHAPLQAPYWPWQKSHRQHHQHTSHATKDRSHPWVPAEDYAEWTFVQRNFRKIPLSALVLWEVYTKLGNPDGSHFWPFSPLFKTNKEKIQCIASGASCFLCAYIAYALNGYAFWPFFKYYYVPTWFFSLWLMVITFLQHKDEEIEAYEEGAWTYVRGQSQTVDRTYGLGIDALTHHITDGHVAHHFFFTQIPHYHLMEATRAVKEALRGYPGAYKYQSTYGHLLEYFRLNIALDYMIGKGTGVLKYRASKDYQRKW